MKKKKTIIDIMEMPFTALFLLIGHSNRNLVHVICTRLLIAVFHGNIVRFLEKFGTWTILGISFVYTL